MDEYRKHISDQIYHTLESAGNLCRLQRRSDPNLLDSIASGLWRFVNDGDVFDQVIKTFVEEHPQYITRILGEIEEDTLKQIINGLDKLDA